MDIKQFQEFSLKILQREFPKEGFKKGEDAEVILTETHQYGLTNLYRKYELDQASIETEIIDSFRQILATKHDEKAIPWQQAKEKLRPQIVQNDYLGVQPKIVHTKFTSNLLVAYVLDMGAMNRYVTTEDALGWGKSQKELHDISLENLESISKGMSMQALGNDIVVIAVNDSYDAARVILPRIQKKMIELLGAEFRVGIPNRDFLIFWSKRLDNEGVKKLEKQISEDFKSMPYPLSSKALFFKGERFSELTK